MKTAESQSKRMKIIANKTILWNKATDCIFVATQLNELTQCEGTNRDHIVPLGVELTIPAIDLDQLGRFKDWYDKLSPSEKCTVWPPNGSGSGAGLYNMQTSDIVDKFLRHQNKSL